MMLRKGKMLENGQTVRQTYKKVFLKYVNTRAQKLSSDNLFNPFPNKPWFFGVCSTSVLKNTVGKREIARNEQFLLFP